MSAWTVLLILAASAGLLGLAVFAIIFRLMKMSEEDNE